jgi:hypothetical protein
MFERLGRRAELQVGAPSNLDPMSSRSSLMFLSVNGTARSYGHRAGRAMRCTRA